MAESRDGHIRQIVSAYPVNIQTVVVGFSPFLAEATAVPDPRYYPAGCSGVAVAPPAA